MSSIPGRSKVTKRKKTPQKNFISKINSGSNKIRTAFLETAAVNHSLSKGEEREEALIKFISENLPKTFSVVKGEVVDLNNSCSPQMDIMVYDNSRNIPFYDNNGKYYILPAEALLASIEIKSLLNKQEVIKSLKSAEKLKALKPFGKDVDISKKQRAIDDKVTCRYFHSIFAFETDIAKIDWAKKEYSRLAECAVNEKIDPTVIDRIFVLDRGLINVTDANGNESNNKNEIFLHFLMNMLNYIQRENARRQTTPYIDYAGKLSSGWIKLI